MPMKALLSAYACRPGWGSEPGVGWNWVRYVARFADVHVVTRELNRPYIEKEIDRSPLPGVEWVYVPTSPRMRETNQIQYYTWQRKIGPVIQKLHARIGFDVGHHITYGVHWLPSPLWQLGIPFIWGPVGGAERADPDLARSLPLRGRLAHTARSVAQRLFELDPQVRSTVRGSTVALAKTRETANRLRALGARHVRVFPAESMSVEDFSRLGGMPFRDARPRRIISIGRLLRWKGFDMGIEAFARIEREFPDAEYWIVGNGGERGYLEKLAATLNLSGRVRFLGSRDRSEVLDALENSDILLHPSMHDSGGWVSLEAMAAGRAVVCLDAGGPGVQVTEETGFKIAPGPRPRVVEDLASALRTLLGDAELRAQLGAEGRKRVSQEFHSNTAERIHQIYKELAGGPVLPLSPNIL